MSQPKYSLETEQEVLETIMHFADPNNIRVQQAMLKLTGDCFYNMDNKTIFAMISDSFRKQEPFHFVDILVKVPQDNNNLFSALSWLIDNYGKCHAGESNFEHYVDRLIVLAKVRKQISLAEKMIKEVRECVSPEDSQEILATALTEISGLNYRESKYGTDNIELAEKYYDGELNPNPKIATTFEQLNEALEGGIKRRTLITIAAGAGVGKTGFALFLMDAIARAQEGTQCLFFSIEMESEDIWMRHVGICAGKQFDKLSKDERMKAITKSMQVPIKIYDLATCRNADDIDFMCTTAKLKAMEKPVSVIVVDYLGLVENKGKFERNDLKQSDIVTKLSKLSIEINCVVILLSQINRASAARSVDDRCPWPTDAADSSGSHRSSALWLGVDRPELYQDNHYYKNQFVVKCRKNRFGKIFELILAFNEGTFEEVPYNYFKKPMIQSRSPEKSIFSGHGKDFY
jgi:replicative DNA helicase